MKRVLVTGSQGFVGPYLLDELATHGYEVAGLDRDRVAEPEGRSLFFDADLRDPAALWMAVEAFQPDGVVHLAAISDVALSFKNPESVREGNVTGTENLFQAVLGVGGASRMLLVGSAYEYGIPETLPIVEDHPLRPGNPYAESKVEAERIALSHGEAIDVLIARSFNHTGPGQTEEFVLSSFAAQIARIERGRQDPVISVGNIEVERDFLDVRDVARAYRLLLEKGRSGAAYNVSSGVAHRISDLLDQLIGLGRTEIEVVSDADRLRPVELPVLQGSHERLTADTGWRPEIEMTETLENLLGYWRERV